MTDEENVLIRKQREELILLTNELRHQELQLNNLFNENIKIKTSMKASRKKSDEYGYRIKQLENEINRLREAEKKEADAYKARITNKESVLSKTCLKLKQLEFTSEKQNQDIESYLNMIKELKQENNVLNLRLNEQSKRIKDFKVQQDGVFDTLKSKNTLLDTAKNQIETLQDNLNQFINIFNFTTRFSEYTTSNRSSQCTQTEITIPFQIEKITESQLCTDSNNPVHFIRQGKACLLSKHDTKLEDLFKDECIERFDESAKERMSTSTPAKFL